MDYIIYVVSAVVGLLISAWVFSMFFQVNKKIALQKIQIKMLYKMAEHAGIDKNELNAIVKFDGDMIALPIK